VLIRFAPLLEQSAPARWLLVVLGLGTAVLAGLVMLTRISIKVRLAWSTVAQMGFMVLECGLGLYTLARCTWSAIRSTRRTPSCRPPPWCGRPGCSACHQRRPASLAAPGWHRWWPSVVAWVQAHAGRPGAWPWWWSAVLGLAWAPLLWLPKADTVRRAGGARTGRACCWWQA
jgi:NAD(P)H-quinone oxidoreductase subunit 5